jgi:hypothetical protein
MVVHVCVYVDYSHMVLPNRGVEGYIRLANDRDERNLRPPTAPSPNWKQPKRKSKLSANLIKPNKKQFTQVCTSSSVATAAAAWTSAHSRDIWVKVIVVVFNIIISQTLVERTPTTRMCPLTRVIRVPNWWPKIHLCSVMCKKRGLSSSERGEFTDNTKIQRYPSS